MQLSSQHWHPLGGPKLNLELKLLEKKKVFLTQNQVAKLTIGQ